MERLLAKCGSSIRNNASGRWLKSCQCQVNRRSMLVCAKMWSRQRLCSWSRSPSLLIAPSSTCTISSTPVANLAGVDKLRASGDRGVVIEIAPLQLFETDCIIPASLHITVFESRIAGSRWTIELHYLTYRRLDVFGYSTYLCLLKRIELARTVCFFLATIQMVLECRMWCHGFLCDR